MTSVPAYEVDVLASTAAYEQFDEVVRESVRAVLAAEEAPAGSTVAVRVVDDSEIERFHVQFMSIPGPTDVISWPSEEGPVQSGFLGDIMLSAETACRQAGEYGHGWAREVAVLAAHGTLHLLGWDDRSEQERERMQQRVDAILDQAGVHQ